jgi:hypothetical protein
MFCQLAANAVDHFTLTSEHSRESFNDSGMIGGRRMTLGLAIGMILWIILVLVVGKWLWNNVLCQVTTVCKPMPNVLYLLGLILLIDIIRPM